MNAVLNTFVLVYAGLFPIVNPIGCAPLFLSMTPFSSDARRAQLARGVAINSFFLLFGSLFFGSYVLEFFGITLPVVRIAGGLVVSVFAWKLLNSDTQAPRPDAQAAGEKAEQIDVFYPLTMPVTVGPGSISVAITLGSQRPKGVDPAHLLLFGAAAVAGLMAMALTVYLVYRSAQATVTRLGETGTAVVTRLSAFIMLCIGIQILWNGWLSLQP